MKLFLTSKEPTLGTGRTDPHSSPEKFARTFPAASCVVTTGNSRTARATTLGAFFRSRIFAQSVLALAYGQPARPGRERERGTEA